MTDATFAELLTPADATVARTSGTVLSYDLNYNGTNFDLARSLIGDAQAATGIRAAGLMAYNGTTYDRLRTALGVTGALGVGGPTASDGVLAVAPVTVGSRASTATPTSMSADGDVVDLWATRFGALNVVIRDTTGAPVSTGSQYTEDAALGAVGSGIGTLLIGRASAAAPTSVSADADAVGLWASRFGALNVILRDTSGAAQSVGGGTQYVGDAAATATPTGTIEMGLANASAPTAVSANNDAVAAWYLTNGIQNVRMVDATGSPLAVGGGTQYVGDAAATATPTGTISMGLANTSAPTDVSAANDAVAAWMSPKGALNVALRDTSGNAIPAVAPVDALGSTTIALTTGALVSGFNGTTYDRARTVQGVAAGANTDLGILAAGVGPGFARANSANLTASGQALTLSTKGGAQAVFTVTGTWVGTVTFEATYDDTTYFAINILDSGTFAAAGAVTANGTFIAIFGAAYRSVRARCSAFTSGTIAVAGVVQASSPFVSIYDPVTYQKPTIGSFNSDGNTTPSGMATNAYNLLLGSGGVNRVRDITGVITGNTEAVGIQAVGIGPGFARVPGDDSLASVTPGAAVDTGSAGSLVFNVSGTWVGTLTWEITFDGSTWLTAAAQDRSTGLWAQTTTVNGNFILPINGYYKARANMTARTSGTAVVRRIVSAPPLTSYAVGDVPNAITDSGSPVKIGGRASNAIPSAVSDGQRVNARYTQTGALSVFMVDQTGNAASVGGGTQYVGDAAATATPTGTMSMGLANSGVPGAVSANNDAVAAWYTPNGAAVTVLGNASGLGFVATAGAGDATSTSVLGLVANSRNSVYNGTSWDQMRSIQSLDAAPNADTGILAVGVGPGWDRKQNPTNLQVAANSAITNTVDGADTYTYYIGTATTGTYTFEVSADDTNFVAATWINAKTGAISSGNLTPAVGDVWAVLTSGWRQVRIRTVTTLGATVAVKTTGTLAGQVGNTVRPLTNARALDIAIVDASGNQITSFGGGTQYVGDAAATATPTGTISMGLANTSAPTDVSAANDAVALWASPKGALNVTLRDTAGAAIPTGVQYVESTAITANAGQGTLVVARRANSLATLTPAVDSAVGLRVGTTGALWMQMPDAAGNAVSMSGAAYADANGAFGGGSSLYVNAVGYLYNGTNGDRARSVEAVSAAPNVDTGIAAVGIGPGWDRKRTASAMAVTLNAATTVVVNGAEAVMFALKFNTVVVGTGTLIFEVTADDTNWVTAPTVLKMPDQSAVSGTFTPATATNYLVGTGGWRQARVRVASALTSGTIDVITTATATAPVTVLADRQRAVTYTGVFRLAEAATSLALSFAQVANTTKQWATIHHAATALKLVKIRKVTFWLYSTSAAVDGVLELRRITSAPATGNPAITAASHDPGAAAAETTLFALPTTAGTEAAVNSPVAHVGLNVGIVAGGTGNNAPIPFVLYDADKYTDAQALYIRPLTLEGWAVDLRSVGASTVKATIEVIFTEE